MTAPLTPSEAARVLWQIGLDIEAKTNDLINLRRGLASKAANYRTAYAAAFLTASGTVEDRKQIAVQKSSTQKFELEAHEQELAACLDKLKELRDRSEIGRAVNSNLKEELRVFNGPGNAA